MRPPPVTAGTQRRHVLSWAVLAAWLAATALAFWWFQGRWQQPFAADFRPYAALAQQPELPAPLQHALRSGTTERRRAVVVDFRDPRCPCTRFNQPHRERIAAQFAARGVDFITIDPASNPELLLNVQRWLPIPASPAAMVFDDEGRLTYFGPYSVGVGCLTGAGNYVERALENTIAGRHAVQLNLLESGCYCPWPAAGNGATTQSGAGTL